MVVPQVRGASRREPGQTTQSNGLVPQPTGRCRQNTDFSRKEPAKNGAAGWLLLNPHRSL